MAKKQILTYPLGTKYRTSDWANQIKDGKGGSIPCNDEIHVGNYDQTVGGVYWQGSATGSDNASASASDNRHWDQTWGGTSQKGLAFWMKTSKNGSYSKRWFDIGAEGGKFDRYCDNNARSSWLSDVTGVYFLFNSHDTTANRDCYSTINQVGIRYRDPSGYIRIKKCTVKLGDMSNDQWLRGSSKLMYGYRLSSSDCSTITGNKNWKFLGLRIQMHIKRGASGVNEDYIQAGVTGLRLYLGNWDNSWNTSNKRAMVGAGNCRWADYDDTKMKLETR